MVRQNVVLLVAAVTCLVLAVGVGAMLLADPPGESFRTNTPASGHHTESSGSGGREAELSAKLRQRDEEIAKLRATISFLERQVNGQREVAPRVRDQFPDRTGPRGDDISTPPSSNVVEADRTGRLLQDLLAERMASMTSEEILALSSLDLKGAEITDADLRLLSALPSLEDLCLSGTAISDAGLAYLRGLSNLRFLDLRGTGVTGAGLWQLPAYDLERLHLTDTDVSASELQNLPAMPKLKTLKLNGLDFEDDMVWGLGHLSSLQHLELDRTPITEYGVRMLLGQHPTLSRIELRGTALSPDGLARLQDEYPKVELVGDS